MACFSFCFVQTLSSPLSRKMAVHVAKHCKGYKPTLNSRPPSSLQWLNISIGVTIPSVILYLLICISFFTSMSGILMLDDGRACITVHCQKSINFLDQTLKDLLCFTFPSIRSGFQRFV